MSHVTNIMVTVGIVEDEGPGTAIHALVAGPIAGSGRGDRFGNLTDGWVDRDWTPWGGTKNPEATVLGGAFNHFDISAFLTWVVALPWEEPQHVRIMVQDQDDDHFTVYAIDRGRARELK